MSELPAALAEELFGWNFGDWEPPPGWEAKALQFKYREDQARDPQGRFTDEGAMLADVPAGDQYTAEGAAAITAWQAEHGAVADRYRAFVSDWTNVGSSQMAKEAVKGSSDRGRELARYLDRAPVERDSIFRGTSALHLEPGFEFQLNPSSFSHDQEVGEQYGLKVAETGGAHPALLEVRPGARGLPIEGLSKYPEKHEVISGGTFRVVSSEPIQLQGYGKDPTTVEHIVVEQIKPPLKAVHPWWKPTRPLTDAEEAMSGTFADERDSGETKLLHLRDLLTKFDEGQHPRDEHGRFTSGDGSTTGDAQAAGDAVAAIATGTKWGHADGPGETTGNLGRWGHNTINDVQWYDASIGAMRALTAAGYSPAVADMTEGWSYGPGIESVRAAAQGNLDYVRGEYPERYAEGAQQLVQLASENVIHGDLWRGVNVEGRDLFGVEAAARGGWQSVQPGMTFDGVPSSWSRDRAVADLFGYATSAEGNGAVLHLDSGAHGLDMAPLGAQEYAWQQEVLVNEPKFMVTSVERGTGENPIIHVAPVPATKALSRATAALLGQTFTQLSIRLGHPPDATKPPAGEGSVS